jgi:hypothetical protein
MAVQNIRVTTSRVTSEVSGRDVIRSDEVSLLANFLDYILPSGCIVHFVSRLG